MSAGSVTVARIAVQDWPELRALRLEAVADTPTAFVESLSDAEALPDEAWQARAARGAPGGDSFQVLARQDGRAVGTLVGFLRGEQTAWLAAVYVTPALRGQGVLAAMLAPVTHWAREQRATRLLLHVHEDNARARAAYARLGLADTGGRDPYPPDPSAVEHVLALPL